MVKIEFGDLGPRYRGRTREEYCASGTSVVDDSEDSVVSFAIGQSGDKVHSDV